jgi:hypothetical protein
MATWSSYAAAAPDLAEEVRALLFQYGSGLGYLATVRADGGPRVHPVSPVIADGGLFIFLIDSPKRRDLERDGRFALHAYPAEDSDLEAYVAGRAVRVTDLARIERVAARAAAGDALRWRLFELDIDVAMVHRPMEAPRIWRSRPVSNFRARHRQLALIAA